MTRAPKARAHGQGSVFQRRSNGLWIAAMPNHGQQGKTPKQFSSKVRAIAELKRDLWLKQHDLTLPEHGPAPDLDVLINLVVERLEPVITEMIERALARRFGTSD